MYMYWDWPITEGVVKNISISLSITLSLSLFLSLSLCSYLYVGLHCLPLATLQLYQPQPQTVTADIAASSSPTLSNIALKARSTPRRGPAVTITCATPDQTGYPAIAVIADCSNISQSQFNFLNKAGYGLKGESTELPGVCRE